MSDIPTYVYPFVIAVIAVVAGRMLGGSAREEPDSLPRWMLWAVAAGCVVIGFVLMGLGGR